MADPYSAASDDIERQRRMLLEATAEQGSVGADSVRRQQQQLAQERDRMLQQAMINASAIGHSAEQDRLNNDRLASLYNDRATQLDAQYQEAQRSAAHRSQATQDYLTEAQAAIPVAREYTRRKLAADEAKAARSRSGSGSDADSVLGVLKGQLGGSIENVNKYLQSDAASFVKTYVNAKDLSDMQRRGYSEKDARRILTDEAYKKYEEQSGLPPGYITATRPKTTGANDKFAKAAGITDETAAAIREKPAYQEGRRQAIKGLTSTKTQTYANGDEKQVPRTKRDLAKKLAEIYPGQPALQALLYAEFAGRYA